MDNLLLIERVKAGDRQAREELVENNLGLVWSIVRRFTGRGYDKEDLFQIGTIGLMKSIDKFDLSFGVQFSTYAIPMITGEVKRFLRDDGLVKVSRGLKENALRIRLTKERLMNQYGREPTMEEIANELQISVEDLVLAQDATAETVSLQSTIFQGDGTAIPLIDKMESKENMEEKVIDKVTIEHALEQLEEKERKLITLRFYEERTQVQVAEELGISQVQVSRLEKKILLSLRKQFVS